MPLRSDSPHVDVSAGAHALVPADEQMPTRLQHPCRAIIFDWDGTAVANRHEDATPLVQVAEPLLDLGVWLVVITGTNFGNIDRQFCQLVQAEKRGHLLVCASRGSEVYGFSAQGAPLRVWYRAATEGEDRALDAVATSVRDALVARTGLDIRIISGRMNRRKIDLIPLPEWADPPKTQIGALLHAVQARFRATGQQGGLASALAEAKHVARAHGLQDARITTDVKHIEIGLTDKRDAESRSTHALVCCGSEG